MCQFAQIFIGLQGFDHLPFKFQPEITTEAIIAIYLVCIGNHMISSVIWNK